MIQRRILQAVGALVLILGIGFLYSAFSDRVAETDSAVVAAAIEVSTTTTVATTTTTSTTTTSTTTTRPQRTAQLAFTGDTLAHRGVVRKAAAYAADTDAEYDFAPMFELVRPTLEAADVAICHLETPLSPDNSRLSGYPTFNVPRDMADSLAAVGYDGCTTASNHSLDRRAGGVAGTLDVLDEAKLKHSGMARDQAEYDAPTIYDAGGIAVASLSYSYGFNGFREPADMPWLVNELDLEEVREEVLAAQEAGAEYVVLSVHWGTEYRHQPNTYQLENAKAIAAIPGIDLVIGHHAHVVQPVDVIDGVPIVYGLGNFLSNQSGACCSVASPDGVIMLVDIVEELGEAGGFVTELRYVPTNVDRSDFTIVPIVQALAADDLDESARPNLEASRSRTAEALTLLGDAAHLTEVG